MAVADVRLQVLQIVNEVRRLLSLKTVTNLNADSNSIMLVNLLNDVIDELSDFGLWQQLYHETTITAQSSVGTYVVRASGTSQPMQSILEVAQSGQIAPLEVRDIQDIRRLRRVNSFGTPRQFAVIGMSGDSPKIEMYPIPVCAGTTAADFKIAGYLKPVLIDAAVTANVSAVPPFPSRVLVKGLYAKALLEEAGGEATNQYQVVYTEYTRMRKEALNRFNADTGTDVYLMPTGGRYG